MLLSPENVAEAGHLATNFNISSVSLVTHKVNLLDFHAENGLLICFTSGTINLNASLHDQKNKDKNCFRAVNGKN